ncbi:hypothetical protein GALMADRAFT_137093 [Galerina marginata CBS 339.88]|uniref:pyranose dehydrogenase (acceptor) n=1 Tax=Galerina marginata (strain CBS 339.88) TaxID=685588 RepID=A0A067T7M9_GALM3|nr:hypothetical protein GALMADRAFT_137093 [Galerina marginata CBS 339.88]
MHSSRFLSFVLTSLFVVPSLGATFTQSSQLKSLTYDYVIIGGGNAGLVVASRLSEDPSVSVLVLEAGVSDQGVLAAEAPFLGPTLTPNTPYDWNYTVVPQASMNGRTFSYPRGRLLGGSSSANYLFHQYGTDEDWQRLSTVSGDSGWSWANLKKYVQQHEKFVPPVDGHNTNGQFIPSLHGFNGMVSVSLPGNNQTIDPRVLATTKQLAEFPYNQDMSGGDHSLLGVGFLQSSAGGGVRSSSSTTYLAKANGRPNLTVLINAYVTKLVQTGTARGGLKSFRGVQFTSSPGTSSTPAGSGSITVTARKEVILSAGSIGTPQILQLSGIGNSKDLKALKINTVLDNPSVGDNLSDHTLLPNLFSVQGTQSFDGVLRDANQVNAAVEQWIQNKTGMLSNNVVNNFGFSRLPSNSAIFKSTRDPAPGPKSPHWEMITSNFYFNPGIASPPTGSFMTIVAVLISPTSRGTVKIRTTNPFDKPLIDPNYLSTAFDIFTMREAVKAVQRFVAAPAWKDYVIGPFGDVFSKAKTDSQIESYVRGLTTTIFHPVGTASMSPSNAKTGVVNPDLTLKGADGIRIVDASVFPFVPSSHTQGPVYLLAERASDLIKAANH